MIKLDEAVTCRCSYNDDAAPNTNLSIFIFFDGGNGEGFLFFVPIIIACCRDGFASCASRNRCAIVFSPVPRARGFNVDPVELDVDEEWN